MAEWRITVLWISHSPKKRPNFLFTILFVRKNTCYELTFPTLHVLMDN